MKRGRIVFLNGTSSSGKTSISHELTNQKEIPFYHLSIDEFFNKYNDFVNTKFPDEPPRGIDHQVVSQIIEPPILSVFHSTIKLLSELGFNVIVDSIIANDKHFNDFYNLLIDYPIFFVGVRCSKEELTRREQNRGDRAIGLAHSQFDYIYSYDDYDLQVNTEELSPVECADKILSLIKSDQDYSVFKNLSKREIIVS